MRPLPLPDPISAYFAADAQSAEALAQCFTPQASVKDEGRAHTGRRAGNFPGSPVDLQYRFRLERGLIVSLEITA